MEIENPNARDELVKFLISKFGREQAAQFAYCLTQQGLTAHEIASCLRAIISELTGE
jgi:hypothetical protein